MLLLCLAGCGTDAVPPQVGSSPLRRLSDTEYQYALRDLFLGLEVQTPPLPGESSPTGFDNDIASQAPSDVRIARYETIANLYAAAVTVDEAAVTALTGCADHSTPTLAASCSSAFIRQFGLRVYRRPLTTEEHDHLAQRFTSWTTALDFQGAVQLTVSTMLQSPQFLYRAEPLEAVEVGVFHVPVEPYAMASRMSFFLWGSIPDDELLTAAGAGDLTTEDGVRSQAARMLEDPRALRLVWDFHRQWLALDHILFEEHEVRIADIDAQWTAATQRSALLESQRFVEQSFRSQGTFGDVLTGRHAVIDGEMARVYGVAAGEVELAEDQRAGLLTRTAFLAGFSHRGGTSPPIRGNAILVRLLCQLPTSPPPDADLSMPVAMPGEGPKTNRTLFEERTSAPACQGCHESLNGFGFGFEHYTASGAYITEQAGLPIDASGQLMFTDVDGPFANAIELSSELARSELVMDCAARRWVQFALGRLPAGRESGLVGGIANRFVEGHGDFRALFTDIVTSPLFRTRKVPPEGSR